MIKKLRYVVEYAPVTDPTADQLPDPITEEIEVTHGDQLRGELEAGKHGLPSMKDAPLNHTTVWVWCALTRLGKYRAPYALFSTRDLHGFDNVKDENTGEPLAIDVPPTTDPSGSA